MNQSQAPSEFPPPPIPNSYWVRPGRLLAGEYPGGPSRAATLERLQRLSRAGVNTFIDLTAEGELAPYVALLPSDGSVTHQRWPIVDHDLPQSIQHMRQILDSLDAALADGRCVYVHCRAGIGRTGTAIGCHLIRNGLPPTEALDRLNELWQQCARSASWPSVPETDAQHHYVYEWREREIADVIVARPDFSQRCQGMLVGLICGEAVGTLALAGAYDPNIQGAVLPLRTLDLGPDATTTLLVLSSLKERGGHDAQDQMQRYLEWSRSAPAEEVPAEFRRALAAWQWSKKPNAGSHDPKNLNPHSLARCVAAALYQHRDSRAAMELAADISRTTQQSPVVLDLCRLWTALLVDALSGAEIEELLTLRRTPAVAAWRTRRLRAEVTPLLDDGWRVPPSDTGDAIAVSARALQALDQADTFVAGLRSILVGPAPPPVVSSLYGAIAGACFGIDAIPDSWQQAVPQLSAVRTLAQAFA